MTMLDPEQRPRLVVGLAGAGLEGALVLALQDEGAQVERCLVGPALAAAVAASPTAAVLVEEALNRLTPAIVADLERAGVPVFVLAPEAHRADWEAFGTTVLPPSMPAAEIAAQVLSAAHRVPRQRLQQGAGDLGGHRDTARTAREAGAGGGAAVIAVAAAAGGVGCTTLSINLAASLGAVADTILFDADFSHPCVAAYLAADVLRSLAALAREAPRGEEAWDRALADELQSLDEHLPRAHLLLGVTRLARAPAITPKLLEDALRALRRRARYVVLDLGGDSLGSQSSARHAALAYADHVLLVARGDAVSLWQARAAAERWCRELGLAEEPLALVVNRHDGRFHQDQRGISRATRLAVAALIPEDHRQAQLAIAAQRPLIFQSRSRAAGALLDLSDRLHGGRIVLPPAANRTTRRWRLPWQRPRRHGTEVTGGAPAIAG